MREQFPLIQDMQSEPSWADVTVSTRENGRKRLRSLIKLIEKRKRDPLYN